jgi:hypothetical protein
MRGPSHLWGSLIRTSTEDDKERLTTLLKVNRHKVCDSDGQWGFPLEGVEVEEHPGEASLSFNCATSLAVNKPSSKSFGFFVSSIMCRRAISRSLVA